MLSAEHQKEVCNATECHRVNISFSANKKQRQYNSTTARFVAQCRAGYPRAEAESATSRRRGCFASNKIPSQ
jgi:hypothetical protein